MIKTKRLMLVALKYARAAFKGRPDRDDLVADVQSVAWQFAKANGMAHRPVDYVRYAVRYVKSRRHFNESVRSIDSTIPVRGELERPEREEFDVADLFTRQTPAEIATLRIDFNAWLDTLSERQRIVAEFLAVGHTTKELARMIGCTPGNVSQYRERLKDSWERFCEGGE